jgi:prepilin-type N-terminal cleavage/methylation domain-containing protein
MKKGFTLIELLVVVLIIGILASIALPKYTLAVNKTRFAKLRQIATSYVTAIDAYRMANGDYPKTFDELSVDAPSGMTIVVNPFGGSNDSGSCAYNQDFYCCINYPITGTQIASVTCGRQDYSFAYQYDLSSSRKRCRAKTTQNDAVQLCHALGTPSSAVINLATPTAHKTGYSTYTIE